jgi:hypothetical protein
MGILRSHVCVSHAPARTTTRVRWALRLYVSHKHASAVTAPLYIQNRVRCSTQLNKLGYDSFWTKLLCAISPNAAIYTSHRLGCDVLSTATGDGFGTLPPFSRTRERAVGRDARSSDAEGSTKTRETPYHVANISAGKHASCRLGQDQLVNDGPLEFWRRLVAFA